MSQYGSEYGRPPFAKNQIYFKMDNQTPFTLYPGPTTFADWGDFTSGPTTVKPFQHDGDAGHVLSSKSPFTGSAGIIGYTVQGSSSKAYIRLLGSNPCLSVRSNWACVKITTDDEAIGQDSYNNVYYAGVQSTSCSFEGKTLKLSGSIGQADNSTAKFLLTLE